MEKYYRHFRNGKIYRFVTFATLEATGEEAVVYQAFPDGAWLCLPLWERDSLGGELATLIRVTDQADGSPTITRSGVGY